MRKSATQDGRMVVHMVSRGQTVRVPNSTWLQQVCLVNSQFARFPHQCFPVRSSLNLFDGLAEPLGVCLLPLKALPSSFCRPWDLNNLCRVNRFTGGSTASEVHRLKRKRIQAGSNLLEFGFIDSCKFVTLLLLILLSRILWQCS